MDKFSMDVRNCARCGKHHFRLLFSKLKRNCQEFSYWASCPKTKEPIMASINEDNIRKFNFKKKSYTFNDCWKMVSYLLKKHARHKKRNFYIHLSSTEDILIHCSEELGEICRSYHRRSKSPFQERRYRELTKFEIIDLIGLLIHLCIREGITESEFSRSFIDKMNKTFDVKS